jgi:hypothetical protein
MNRPVRVGEDLGEDVRDKFRIYEKHHTTEASMQRCDWSVSVDYVSDTREESTSLPNAKQDMHVADYSN